MSEKSDFDPRFDPAFQRGFAGDGPAVAAPIHEPVRSADPAPEGVVESRDLSTGDEPDPASLRGNPWVTALWIVGGVLVVGGVWAEWQATMLFAQSSPSGATDFYVIPTVFSNLSPWFVGVGLLGLLAAVVLHAVRWRPGQ